MYLVWKLPTLRIGVKCCWLVTGFWWHFLPSIAAYVCTEVVGNGSLRAMGQAHHKWSSLEWSRGWLWSRGMLSLCRASCVDEGNHLPEVWLWACSSFTCGAQAGGRRCSGTCLKWEHRVCLTQSWLIFRHCWNRWLFLYALLQFFFSYVIIGFLFCFLLL